MGQFGLSERLAHFANEFTPTEKKLARHLVANPEEWSFSGTGDLSDSLKVHRSTMSRFAQRLGYAGFPALREAVRAEYIETIVSPFSLSTKAPSAEFDDLVHKVYLSETQNLQRTYSKLDGHTLERAAHDVAEAKRVLVFGRRFSFTIAMHTSLLIRSLRPGVMLAPDPGGSSLDVMFDLRNDDAAIVFSLRRHSPEVQRAVELLVNRGVPTTLITDAAPLADIPEQLKVLQAHIGSTSTIESFTSLVSLGHALAVIVKELIPDSGGRQSLLEESRLHFHHS